MTIELDAKTRELAESASPEPATHVKDDAESIQSGRQNLVPPDGDHGLAGGPTPLGHLHAGGRSRSISCRPWRPRPWRPIAIAAKSIPGSACMPCCWDRPTSCTAIRPTRLNECRAAWHDARAAYFDRDDPEAASQFAAAMRAVHVRSPRPGRGDRARSAATSHRRARSGVAGQDGLSLGASPPTPKCFTIGSIRSSGRAARAWRPLASWVCRSWPSASRSSGPASP